MKKTIFTILATVLLSCTNSTEPSQTNSFVGYTFSGYSYTSVISKSKIYEGYKFISKDSVEKLLLEENSRIISKSNHHYILNYPKIDIEDNNTKDGFWHGEFQSETTLKIRDILMTKW